MTRLLLTLFSLTFTSAVVSAAEPGWQAGFAKVAITPDQPMWMSGYASRTAPAAGKETDLWAKAAVLQAANGKKLVLVTLDLVGIDRGISQAVCKLVQEKHGLPREAIVLSVSHTHCGPVVGTTLRSMYFLDAEQTKQVMDYSRALPGKIAGAVDAAMANLGPVKLSYGVGQAGFAPQRLENGLQTGAEGFEHGRVCRRHGGRNGFRRKRLSYRRALGGVNAPTTLKVLEPLLDERKLVSQLVLLDLQVAAGVLGGRDLERQGLVDRQAVPL